MTHYELGFKLQRDSPYDDFSKRYPSIIVAFWCNDQKDVLEITYEDLDGLDGIQRDLKKVQKALGARTIRMAFTRSNIQLVAQHCGCANIRHRVSPIIEKHNCLEVQPITYNAGWEWRRIIAFQESDLKALFRELDKFCDIEIVSRRTVEDGSVRDTFVISTTSLFGELTEKQTEALLLALDSGYYRVPKRATGEEIAKRFGLPRTTFEEHLRKAESKVLNAVAPYAQFSTGGRRKTRLGAARAITR